MKKKYLCIYHKNCVDGFMAATIVKKALGEEVSFLPGVYQTPAPLDEIKDRDVILVDFSYPREVILEMAKHASHILILDHHQSAEKQLVDLPDNVEAHFDMHHCGAVMTWMFYYPDRPLPVILFSIEDNDLWLHERAETKKIMAFIFLQRYDFDVYQHLLESSDEEMEQVGEYLLQKQEEDIKEHIESCAYTTVIAGHTVPVLNCPHSWSSEAGVKLDKGQPFAACYRDTKTGREYSLRSDPDGIDVSLIAGLFGGGGHQHAAGFSLAWSDIDKLETGLGGDDE